MAFRYTASCGECPEAFESAGGTAFEAFHRARRKRNRHRREAHPQTRSNAAEGTTAGSSPARRFAPKGEEKNAA